MSTKPLVYVAGAYTQPDPIENTHNYLQLGTQLVEDGYVTPFIPHVTLLWHMVTPRPYQFWLDYDKDILARCDALLRSNQDYSSGADEEERLARELGIPVFYFKDELYDWVLLNDKR